jgi:CRP-like cAMP-binding protein
VTAVGAAYDRLPRGVEEEPVPDHDHAETLKWVPLFRDLNQRQLKRLSRLCEEASFTAGTTVMAQGQRTGITFFVIVEGEALVSVDGTDVARLGPGQHFGELALISEGLRSATVTAEFPLRCLAISFWDFRNFVRENPDVAWKLMQHLAALLIAERERATAARGEPVG